MGIIKGFIDTANESLIKGWAFEEGIESPIIVKVYIDDVLISHNLADIHRPGILQKGLHPTGNCEFQMIPPENLLKENSIIRVYAGENNKELNNSPWVCENLRVLIVGLAKSGTSILTYRIAEAIPDSKIFFEPNGAKGFNNLDLHLKICENNKAVTKCLFPWHDKQDKENIKKISRLYEKKIWIIRDPRDNIISNYLYMWNTSYNAPKEKFEAALKMTQEKEKNPTSIPFYQLFKTLNDPGLFVTKQYDAILRQVVEMQSEWHILKYEDLVSGNLEALNNYLGLEVNTTATVPENLNRVVRSKKSGNWREWFTEEDIKFYKPIMEKYLDFFNYDADDWVLSAQPELSSEKGSEYMNKLHHGKL